jgi:hypothetical protein
MAFDTFFFCRFFVVHISLTRTGELTIHHLHSPIQVEGICTTVLPGDSKGPFAILVSPSRCHATFSTMPHTLAALDHSPVCCSRTLTPLHDDTYSWILEGVAGVNLISSYK